MRSIVIAVIAAVPFTFGAVWSNAQTRIQFPQAAAPIPGQLHAALPSLEPSDPPAAESAPAPSTVETETIYLDALCEDLAARLGGRSVGYQVVAMLPSGNWCGIAGGMARRAPDTNPRAMTVEDKITIASVSKTITAVATMRALTEKSISVDSPAARYLPADWTLGPNMATMTFRDFLTQRTGWRCGERVGTDLISFDGLKQCVQNGAVYANTTTCRTAWTLGFCYQNENFAILRILIPRLLNNWTRPLPAAGNVGGNLQIDARAMAQAPDQSGSAPLETVRAPPGSVRGPAGSGSVVAADTVWDAARYANAYIAYVNNAVFRPLGLPAMACKPTETLPALSYKSATADPRDFSSVQAGEIWGDMTLRCGSQGWVMSAHQLAIFMHGFSHSAKILPVAVHQQMLDGSLGVYWSDHGDGLQSWSHGGLHPAEWNMGEVNARLMAFSNGVSIAAITNSKFDGDLKDALVNAVRAGG